MCEGDPEGHWRSVRRVWAEVSSKGPLGESGAGSGRWGGISKVDLQKEGSSVCVCRGRSSRCKCLEGRSRMAFVSHRGWSWGAGARSSHQRPVCLPHRFSLSLTRKLEPSGNSCCLGLWHFLLLGVHGQREKARSWPAGLCVASLPLAVPFQPPRAPRGGGPPSSVPSGSRRPRRWGYLASLRLRCRI